VTFRLLAGWLKDGCDLLAVFVVIVIIVVFMKRFLARLDSQQATSKQAKAKHKNCIISSQENCIRKTTENRTPKITGKVRPRKSRRSSQLCFPKITSASAIQLNNKALLCVCVCV